MFCFADCNRNWLFRIGRYGGRIRFEAQIIGQLEHYTTIRNKRRYIDRKTRFIGHNPECSGTVKLRTDVPDRGVLQSRDEDGGETIETRFTKVSVNFRSFIFSCIEFNNFFS